MIRILKFIKDHMVFLPDPRGVEAIGTPAFHLGNIFESGATVGDCDDAATLAGAMVEAAGAPARLMVASFLPGGRLHHIWAEGRAGRRWVQLDPFRAERFAGVPSRLVAVRV